MKKLVISLFIFIIGLISSVAQSSANLIEQRKAELKNLENADLPDKEKRERMKEIDNFYKPLIEVAIKNEGSTTPTSTSQKGIGTSLVFNNPNGGSVQSNNYSIEKTAQAYATIAYANAYSELVTAVANNITTDGTGKIETTVDLYNQGFEGAFFNRYKNQKINVTITGNNGYVKTFSISANSVQYIRLLPGIYKVSAQGERDSRPGEKIITVDGLKDFRGDDNKDYDFGANVGRS